MTSFFNHRCFNCRHSNAYSQWHTNKALNYSLGLHSESLELSWQDGVEVGVGIEVGIGVGIGVGVCITIVAENGSDS